MSRGNPGIKARPGACHLAIQENDTRDAIVTVADPQNASRTLAYIQIGAESWGPILAAAPELRDATRDLLKAFRECIGAAAFWEFEQSNPAVRAAQRALAKADL